METLCVRGGREGREGGGVRDGERERDELSRRAQWRHSV